MRLGSSSGRYTPGRFAAASSWAAKARAVSPVSSSAYWPLSCRKRRRWPQRPLVEVEARGPRRRRRGSCSRTASPPPLAERARTPQSAENEHRFDPDPALDSLSAVNSSGEIVVSGAREHNLKDLHLRLPRNSLIVITGLSGSGKSSLAFDTIYAEGQRRYVESLSAYARQFLGQMDKPDVDSIEGLSPAISIDQKTTSRNPRSTVGTVTEIYDYLRLPWARVGHPHCFNCGRPIAAQSAEQIIDQVMMLPEGAKFMVLAPVVRGRKGEYGKLFEELRSDGFTRVKGRRRAAPPRGGHRPRQEVQARHLGRDRPARDAAGPAQAAGRLDRDGGGARRGDRRHRERGDRRGHHLYSERFMCLHCGTSMPELEPRMFSFNSPHGACPRCTGSARRWRSTRADRARPVAVAERRGDPRRGPRATRTTTSR